jgi:CubicO group peptidase (beta-lactamase class C family)
VAQAHPSSNKFWHRLDKIRLDLIQSVKKRRVSYYCRGSFFLSTYSTFTMYLYLFALAGSLLIPSIYARCYDPSPAFPPPDFSRHSKGLTWTLAHIEKSLEQAVSNKIFAASSYSVEITSSKETLWSSHHTAKDRNESRIGAKVVNSDSVYRIASITKTFTTLGILQQHAAGNLSLDDPVHKYIAELQGPESGNISWKHITLRTLASQLSGIPREC